MKKILRILIAAIVALTITIVGSIVLAEGDKPRQTLNQWSDGKPHVRDM